MKAIPLALSGALALAACGKSEPSAPAAAPATEVSSVFKSGPPQTAAAATGAPATVLARGLAVNGAAEAQVVEATRQAGVLTLRVRFQRVSGQSGFETVYGSVSDRNAFYVVAGANKLFPLTDAEDKPLITPDLMLKLGGDQPVAGVWFGKFPAPPPEVKSVSLVLPKTEPLDNIPLTDR